MIEQIGQNRSSATEFERTMLSEHAKKKKLAKNMLNYCKLDTFAMVKVLDRLETFR